MKQIGNWQIKVRLVTAFTIIAAIGGLTGILGVSHLSTVERDAESIYDNILPLRDIATVRASFTRIRVAAGDMLISHDSAERGGLQRHIDELNEKVDSAFKSYETHVDGEEETRLTKQFRDALASFREGLRKAISLANQDQDDQAAAVLHGALKNSTDSANQAVDQLVDHNVGQAKISIESSQRDYGRARWQMFAVVAIGFLLAVGIGVWIANSIARPLARTVEVLEAVAKGDLTQQLDVDTTDEVGRMARALNQAVGELRDAFQGIAGNAEALATAAEELASVSQEMSHNAAETAAQAGVVSAASEQVSKNVETVATAAEEMTASIKEIAKNASDAARVSTTAVRTAETTNTSVAKLGESSADIGKVIKVITSIAEQTNLLALNATIEAARAGEAGKGFAVVANEVKELAKETAKSTEDISVKIQAIQTDTRGAVAAIEEITGVIHQINDISGSIASAVEQQSVTTNEIGRNVSEAAKGSGEIAQNITGVAHAAQSTTSGASEAQKASTELARMAAELQSLVGRFHYEIRNGSGSGDRAWSRGRPASSVEVLRKPSGLSNRGQLPSLPA